MSPCSYSTTLPLKKWSKHKHYVYYKNDILKSSSIYHHTCSRLSLSSLMVSHHLQRELYVHDCLHQPLEHIPFCNCWYWIYYQKTWHHQNVIINPRFCITPKNTAYSVIIIKPNEINEWLVNFFLTLKVFKKASCISFFKKCCTVSLSQIVAIYSSKINIFSSSSFNTKKSI